LLDRWLPADPALPRILKTDLFDELAGDGLYPALSARARRVVGVDISAAVVDSARRRHPSLEAHVADVRELPFEAGTFDAVVSNSTLDHLVGRSEVAIALGELARVLRPGGRLIVTLDNPINPLIALRNALPHGLARILRRVPYQAGWTCGPRALRRLLDETGFGAVETTAILHAPRFVVVELDRHPRSRRDRARSLRLLLAAERLGRSPTRFLTGHFVAALAVRRPGPAP